MNTPTTDKQTASGSWIIVLLGIWVLVSPFVLGYDGERAGMLSTVVVGALLIIVGLGAARVNAGFVAVSVPLAAWLFISAFVLHLWGLSLLWSNVLLAFVIMATAGITEGIGLPRVAETTPRP